MHEHRDKDFHNHREGTCHRIWAVWEIERRAFIEGLMMWMYGRAITLMLLLPVCLAPSGCAGYVLHGQAVHGSYSHISVSDGRQDQNAQGVGGVRIAVYRDPGRLSQKLIATGTSEPDGTFAIPLPAFGAGWMEEEWMIQATRNGFQSAEGIFPLPLNSRSRPIRVMLSPGTSIPFEHRDDYLRDLERFQ